jgi:Na+/H+-dicarboxylate symporter
MDISLLGGGWSFLLEFSTVIVIIFTLLILGIASVIQGKDIVTILASIAGYVLGKATSGSSPGLASGAGAQRQSDERQTSKSQ